MGSKTELSVKLFAGDTLVDASNDVALWQRVLSEIRGLAGAPVAPSMVNETANSRPSEKGSGPAAESTSSKTPIAKMAASIGVTVDELESALSPSDTAPFVSIDSRTWAAFKKVTPPRGQGSISSAALAATALALWKKHQEIGDVTLLSVRAVLEDADLQDVNAGRSLSNCEWLQAKGDAFVIKPVALAKAESVLRAFCKREAPSE